MTKTGTSIDILGKTYQIKCPESEIASLQRAARYLEDQMRSIQSADSLLNVDRVAIVAALNIVHQLLTLEQQKNQQIQSVHQRLYDLQNRIEGAIEQNKQLELDAVK